MDISCIILAGGNSLRLGHDKVLEKVGNKTLLQQVMSSIGSLGRETIIVTAEERTLSQLVSDSKFKRVPDILPGKGPLGGIYTGLVTSDSFYNLVVACDMPFLNQSLLSSMIQISSGFDLVVPRLGKLVEPLHAVYSKGCLAPIERLLRHGNLEVRALFELVKVRYVDAKEIDVYDPKHLSFFNINTQADLERAQQLLREISGDKR